MNIFEHMVKLRRPLHLKNHCCPRLQTPTAIYRPSLQLEAKSEAKTAFVAAILGSPNCNAVNDILTNFYLFIHIKWNF